MPNLACFPKLSPTLRRAVALAVFALVATPLGAQTAPASGTASTPASAAPAPAPLTDVMVAFFEHDFSANLTDGASGKLSENQFGVGSQYTHDSGDNHRVVSWAYIYTNNDFSGTAAPFGNMQQFGLNGYFAHDFFPDWGAFGYLSAGLSADTAASFSRGGQIAVALGPTYQVSKDLSLALGPMYYTRMEDANTVIPMADAKWAFWPQWDLHAYLGVSNGVTVSYDVFNNHATVLDASVEYNSSWFRLRDNAVGAGQAVDESNTTVKFGVRQALCEYCFVRGFVSGIFDREYQFHANGGSTNSFNVKPTLGLGVELGVAF